MVLSSNVQFAYQPGISVEDTIILLLHQFLPHLENMGGHCKSNIFFFLLFQCLQQNTTTTAEEELEYKVVTNFVELCKKNHFKINGSKTKEKVINFCHKVTLSALVNIQGVAIEVVSACKYLGVHLNNNLDWSHNTDAPVQEEPKSSPPCEKNEGILKCVRHC